MVEISARDRLKLLGGAGALLVSACGGGGSSSPQPTVGGGGGGGGAIPPSGLAEGVLRDSFRNDFKIGAALSSFQVANGDVSATLAQSQFNSITPEFQLKPDIIAPTEGVFDFSGADALVDWAIANGMEVRGHALVWHEATPAYFLEGTNVEIRARLETYVSTVVEHFRGRITVWDVANEVTSTDIYNGAAGVGPDRRTEWFETVGNADYLDWAFLAARAADPNAQLFLNDYNTENTQKRGWLIEIIQRLQDRGVPIDGVGHQMHIRPDISVELALQAIDDVDNQFMGMINHITEFDMDVYTNPGSCWTNQTGCEADIGPTPSQELLALQAQKMRGLFDGFRVRPSVESVTTWGVVDSDSWLNTAPIERFNYPLLFDREGEAKPAFFAITDENYEI